VIRTRRIDYYWATTCCRACAQPGDAQRWPDLFERLIAADQPQSTHRAFGWMQDASGDIAGFLATATAEQRTVMQATDVRACRRPPRRAVAAACAAWRTPSATGLRSSPEHRDTRRGIRGGRVLAVRASTCRALAAWLLQAGQLVRCVHRRPCADRAWPRAGVYVERNGRR